MITWPPSNDMSHRDKNDAGSIGAPSFLIDECSTSSVDIKRKNTDASAMSHFAETQPVESQSFGNYSDASSIGRFPSFHFSMHALSSLSQLTADKVKSSTKINLLLAVLEVEGPETLRLKKGIDTGQEVSVLKLILGDEEGYVVRLTAWRETAEDWGGSGTGVATKRGDIVHIESKRSCIICRRQTS